MFADDLLLFGEVNEKQLNCVMETLKLFCNISGQEVSQEKTSIIFSKNVPRSMKTKLNQSSKYKAVGKFGKYLGVPLSGKKLGKKDFQYMVDQIASKLSFWKQNNLSLAGRITLAKSVIEEIPLYPMMTTKLPKTCIKEIHGMQCKFIWGDSNEKRRIHVVGWEMLTEPKALGGVGLRNLEVVNIVCLMKLGWKLHNRSTDLWCNVLREKYMQRENGEINKAKAYDSSLWKDITRVMPVLYQTCFWCVGDGKTINVWEDNWMGKSYNLTQWDVTIPNNLRGAKVCDLINNNGEWNFDILQDWLPMQWINKLHSCMPPREGTFTDVFCFADTRNEEFSFKDVFNAVSGFADYEEDGNWSAIWKLQVPERCRRFIWLLHHDRLLTNHSRSRKGIGSATCNI